MLHGTGYTAEDRLSFIPSIFENVATNTATLLQAAAEWDIPISAANQARNRLILRIEPKHLTGARGEDLCVRPRDAQTVPAGFPAVRDGPMGGLALKYMQTNTNATTRTPLCRRRTNVATKSS